MHNQSETVLVHYTEGVSVPFSKNNFYDKKFQFAVNFMYNVKCHGFAIHCFIH